MIALADAARGFLPLLPEGIVGAGLCAVLVADLAPKARAAGVGLWVGLLACAAAFVVALLPAAADAVQSLMAGGPGDAPPPQSPFLRPEIPAMLALDRIAALARPAIVALTALVLLAGAGERRGALDHGAWATAVLGIGLGAMLVSSAANMVPLWLGLELISLSSYVLAAWRGGDRRAAEAGMKYVLFGGASSALMLFGISHVYGMTGHFDFAGIGRVLAHDMPLPVIAALCLCGAGVAYKLTLVPFHFYAPDVYQGAPALSVAAVAAVPKLAAGAALLRALGLVLPASLVPAASVGNVLAAVAMASLLVASLTALAQRDGKRIVAFSGIGHGGTVVLALACLPGRDAAAAAGFYLLAYAGANLGALLCLSVLERERRSCALESLAGAVQSRPWVSALLCLFLFSLAGVPPLAGFLGKWSVLQQALAGGPVLVAAALALLASTAIFAWSYLLIVRAVVLAPATAPAAGLAPARPAPLPLATTLVLLVCAAATLGLGLWLDGLPAIARSLQP